jgi:hypothetical protein
MRTFTELLSRLQGLILDLDGEIWEKLLKDLNPPNEIPNPNLIHDMAFRDAKALAGYVPDLRSIIRNTSPKAIKAGELESFKAIFGLFKFSARLPVVLLSLPDYKDTENLINLYNGYRQTLVELEDYLRLASPPTEPATATA